MHQKSPYMVEKDLIIDRLVKIYPYPKSWFEKQNLNRLNAMYNNKVKSKPRSQNKRN